MAYSTPTPEQTITMIFALAFYALVTGGLFVLLAKNWVSLASYRAHLGALRRPAPPIVFNNDIAREDGSNIPNTPWAKIGAAFIGLALLFIVLIAVANMRNERNWDPDNTRATPGQLQAEQR